VGRTTDGDDFSPLVRFEVSFRRICPHLIALLAGGGRFRYRELAVTYRGPGDYLGRVKALDTRDARPVVAFAAASTYESALCRLDVAVHAERWKLDRYAGDGWAQ
jgi:hypothetical protein